MPRCIVALSDYLRRLARLLALEWRRRFLCPRGRHDWRYFGNRSRVCRACHKEQWRYLHADPEWDEPSRWAESTRGAD